MLELNQSNSEEISIKDVNEDTFMDDVIEASKSSPIVVDFGRLGVDLVKH